MRISVCADSALVSPAVQLLPEREARVVIAQVVMALAYLNREDGPRIIHFDLKPANVMFDRLGTAKVTDFGLSKVRCWGAAEWRCVVLRSVVRGGRGFVPWCAVVVCACLPRRTLVPA
jgi:serine/threonine protein kinase